MSEEKEEIKTGGEETPEQISSEKNTQEKPETEKPQPEKKEKPKKKSFLSSRKFRHGSLSVVFTVIFIAAVVLINVIVNLVLDRFNIAADLTEGAIFTLSDKAKDYINGVQDDISLYVTADKETYKSSGEPLYEQIVEFLDKMAGMNGKFSVRYVNLITDPDFSNDYTEDLKNNQVIVKSGKTGRYRILDIADFLRVTLSDGNTYDYGDIDMQTQMYIQYGYYQITGYSSTAEEKLISAVMSVSDEDPTVVTFITGYGESDSSALEKILTDNAYDVRKLEIDKVGAIDADTDITVVYAPTKDYSAEALNKLDEWLSNGGKYGRDLVYISTVSAVSLPNIDEFLSEWGIVIEGGYILQLDGDHVFYSTSRLPLMQDLEIKTDTDYYNNMKTVSGSRLMGYPVRPVTKLWEGKSNLATKTIVSAYGEKCLLYPFDAAEDWAPSESDCKSYDVAVEGSKVQFEGNTPVYSKVIAVGSDQMFVDYFTGASNYSNAELALTLFDTNSENTGEKISITEKNFTAETYQIDEKTSTAIGLTFAVFVPLAIIVLGIFVWARRRRL